MMMNGVKVVGLLSISIPLVVIITRYYLSPPEPKLHKLKLKKKPEELKEEIKSSSSSSSIWCELDSNLLGEILGRLCLTDQARFRAVCKNWLAAPHSIITDTATASARLPWWVKFNRNTHQLQIYDTSLSSSPNYLASIQNISFTNLGIPSPSTCSHIRATLNHNWFFISIFKPPKLFSSTLTYYFLLFSPFTKKFITLPQFRYSTRFSFRQMFSFSFSTQPDSFFFRSTFSTRPDSPDCVFFLLDTTNNAPNITLLTYRNGDQEWIARQFNAVPEFLPATYRPIYLHGILYIVSPFGQLASYNIFNQDFQFENLILDELFLQNVFSTRARKIFKLNGELMIMFFDLFPKTNVILPGKPCIRRYDWSSKVWIPVSTLGDKALFVGEKIVGVSKVNTKDRRNNGVLSNKIYHVFNGGCLIYSIQDGDLVEYKSITSNLLEDGGGGGDLREYKYTCGIEFSYRGNSTYWLEPPCVRSSNNQEVHGFRD